MKDGREGQIKGEKRGEERKGRRKLAPKPKKTNFAHGSVHWTLVQAHRFVHVIMPHSGLILIA